MIIHWSPCYDHRPISRTQPEPEKIVITHGGRTLAVDFSDSRIVEFDLEPPVTNYVHRAWREGGVLHLAMPSYGRLPREVVIDHEDEEVLSWHVNG